MSLHTALLDLPGRLVAAGLRVVEMRDWELAQGTYFWTLEDGTYGFDVPPSGYMVHHTAGTSARPVVRTSSGEWSKANGWLGLDRDGVLYSSGGGVPTLYLTAAGPARVSSGYGSWPVLEDYVFRDERAPWRAEGPDGSRAANRYVFNVETVHPGDGSPLDPGVWDYVVELGVQLHRLFGWDERTIGHLSWTQRKIDPYWDDRQDCIIAIQDGVNYRLGGGSDMDLVRWASRHREQDIHQYHAIGVLTAAEVSYWVAMLGDWLNPEWQDLRDAAKVRGPLYGHPGMV